jgi:hypothetical protein
MSKVEPPIDPDNIEKSSTQIGHRPLLWKVTFREHQAAAWAHIYQEEAPEKRMKSVFHSVRMDREPYALFPATF